jgi:alanyl-tRNA synthetase
LRADLVVREVALTVGGRGGGKPHMAQAGVDADKLPAALAAAVDVFTRLVTAG